jgi:hypothetical protein
MLWLEARLGRWVSNVSHMQKVVYMYSAAVIGKMSPKPIVVSVVTAQ